METNRRFYGENAGTGAVLALYNIRVRVAQCPYISQRKEFFI